MGKRQSNNTEVLNEFVEALKFTRKNSPYRYKDIVKGASTLIIKYNSTLGRFIFKGYYDEFTNMEISCINCTSVECIVRKFIKDRYLI